MAFDDDDPRPQHYVERWIVAWAKHGFPRDVLAHAMLAAALNEMIAMTDDPKEVAALLFGMACEISPPETAGRA